MRKLSNLIWFLAIALTVLSVNGVRATHVPGGNISYVCTNSATNEYLITLTIYEDCGGTASYGTGDLTIDVTNDCSIGGLTNFTVSQTVYQQEVSQLCAAQLANSECNGGGLPGVYMHQWEATINLPGNCDSWTFSYDICCQNTANNVNGQPTVYWESTLNNADAPCNNSPVVTAEPVPYVCNGQPVSWSPQVTEPDGNTLVFTFIDAMTGPTTTVTYNGGFSGAVPIPGITIDPSTGLIQFTPSVTGNFVIAVLIEEYDGAGNLVGSVVHEFQFEVINCTGNMPSPPVGGMTNFVGTASQIDSNSIAVCNFGDNFCFDLVFTDADPGDNITVTSNIASILPGATIVQSGTNPATATLCWTAVPGYSGNLITVVAEDDGCPISGQTSLIIDLTLFPTLAATGDTTVCGNYNAYLSATGGGPYTWSVVSGEPIVLGTNFTCNPCANPIATPTVTTTYEVTDVCGNTDQATVTVVDNTNNVSANILNTAETICPGSCVELVGNGTVETLEPNLALSPFEIEYSPTLPINSSIPTTISQQTVSGLCDTELDSGDLVSVCITLGHTFMADLDMYLTCPDGTQLMLSTDNGGNGNNFQGCFTFDAVTPVTAGSAAFTGNYIPEGGSLATAFNGCNPNGQWTLSITDDANGDSGGLLRWTMIFRDSCYTGTGPASNYSWSPSASLSNNDSTHTDACPGATELYTLTVTDHNGCFDTDTVTVFVDDQVDPTALCQNITAQLNALGTVTISPNDIDNGSFDDCLIQSMALDQTTFNCSDIGSNTVTLTVTDAMGNTDQCNATVTIEDNIPPTVNCQNITVSLDAAGNASIVAGDIVAFSSDNCLIASTSISQSNFNCSHIGANVITVTVVDGSGNISTCNSTVTIEDNLAPTALCQNISINLDGSGNASIVAADVDGGSSDNCGIASLAISNNVFDCSDIGVNNVVLTVTDVNGNVSTCNAQVTVNDNTPPVATCQNVTVNVDATGNASITTGDIDNGSSDNCGIASLSLDQSAFTCADIGANNVTLTVTDVSGNTSTCNGVVTVVDNIPPTVSCQNITIQLDATGNASIVAGDIVASSSDNCSIASTVLSQSAFTCTDLGANVITVTVTDVNGNTATCNSTVTVEDNILPSAVCQNISINLDGTGNATIVAADVDGGSSDNCGIASLTVNTTTFDCSDVGANTVTLTVTDDAGNVSTCNATVTVVDNIAPTALCQNITIQLDATGNATISTTDIDNGSSDNCSVASLALDQTLFTCGDVGANTVTLTVTDPSGNVSTCNATVTVQDIEVPVITCPANQTVAGDVNCQTTLLDYTPLVTASDNCGVVLSQVPAAGTVFTGSTTVTITATDPTGNAASCSFDVTVFDATPPTAICQDITVNLDGTGNFTIVATDVDNGSFDNCGIASLAVNPSTFDCSDVGVNTVTLTVTDLAGNTATCFSDVTVVDNIPPTAVCQNITIQLDATGNVSIVAADIDGGSTDNCSVASLAASQTAFDCSHVGANNVTLTVTDPSGNFSTCAAVVTVEDIELPTITCPGNQTETPDANCEFALIDYTGLAIANDNCSAVVTQSPAIGTVITTTTTVTLTATDPSGNTATCTFDVLLDDTTPPTAVCQNITVQLDATGNIAIVAADIDNGSNDNCGAVTLSATPLAFTCADIGANTVTLTVTDGSGNVSTCNATVTVEDNLAPTAVCQNITVSLDAAGNATITTADIDNGSSDNCGIASLSLDQTAFTCADVGANTVTLTVTDVNGNTSTCTATVTVEDNIAPSATCQDITVALDAAGNAAIVAGDVVASSSDNCGIASTTLSQSNFTCADVGVNTITITVTDDNGNVSTCTSDVTIEDNTNPTAVCQNITVQLDATGNIAIVAADVDGGSSDNCGAVTLSATPTAFTCADVGANTVTLTVTDGAGNVSTCNATVTVEDNLAPTAVCQNITAQLDASGNVTITTADIDNGSSDNCGIASLSLDQTAFTCADVGANTVTLTVTDVNGNTSTCTATATVEDNIAPSVTCQDITVALDAAGNATIVTGDVVASSSDNCGIASTTLSQSNFTCADVGVNTITITVTDDNGNVSTCTSDVTIEDNTNPTAVCQNITVQLDATGNIAIVAADVDGGSSDNCGAVTLSATPLAFTCADLGANTVTLTVTDGSGNVSTCNATVTVEDNIAPTAVCQNITVQLDATGNASIVPADIDNGSSDNCSVVSTTLDITAFTCADLGANTVTLTVEDQSGNTSTCAATVTVEDNIAPTINCPADQSETADAACQFTMADYTGLAGAGDNCSVVITQSPIPGTVVAGSQVVTLTATDPAGNTTTCTFNVVVVDNTPPTAVCQDITVQLDATGNASIVAADIDNGSSDNCAVASMSLDITAFTCADIGANTVTLTVTDGNGNTDQCTATVTVEDNVAPTALCQNITVQLDATGNAAIVAADIDGGSTDNCSVASLAASQTAFTCADVGANNVTLTVTDGSGNTSTCVAVVTVEDNVPPVAVCQNITVQLDATGNAVIVGGDVDNGSSDNCGPITLSVTPSAFTCAEIGANNVTLTVTDLYGNTDQCVAVVTVEDNVAPTAVCQNITIQLDATGNVSIVAADIDGGSTDNCSIASLAASQTAFDCSHVGANNVTLAVTDGSGNTATCVAVVTVEDVELPTITCPANQTETPDANCEFTLIDYTGLATANDNCSAVVTQSPAIGTVITTTTTATLTATDPSGNTATCTFDVLLDDTTPPTAVCQNITVQLDATGNIAIVAADVDGGSSDNCGAVTLSATPLAFTCADIGANTVTLTVTDGSGNVSTCNATVTVEDNLAPTAVCQNITVQLDATGNATITTADIDNGSTDNCSVASLALDVTAFTCADVGANNVTLTVTDPSGNFSTCAAVVTVEDVELPTITCPGNQTETPDANCEFTLIDYTGLATAADNCSAVVTQSPAIGTVITTTTTVTLTATDPSGNTATCTFDVLLDDTTPPTAVCQNITVQLDATGNIAIVAADVDGGSSDNCGAVTLSATPLAFTCADLGANTVTLTVTDGSGNVSTCNATVTVEDNIAPTAVCQNITVQLDATGNASIVPADIDNGSSDNCSVVSTTLDITAFTCADLGANTVTLTVEDQSGNTSTCAATVTVEDNIAPTINCPADQSETADAACQFTMPDYTGLGTTTDNCSSVITQSPLPGTVVAGSQVVTLTATDPAGNTTTCTFNVVVVDNTPPTAVCQDITVQLDATGNATITAADIDNGSSDNCAVASMSLDITAFTCGDLGANTVTLTVVDGNGNTDQCTATVTVEDNVAPTALCQNITVQLDATGNASIVAADIDGGSTDNCSVASLAASQTAFTCADVGANNVTLTVTDGSGNTSTCVAVVTVEDNVPPVAVCQNITVQLDATGNAVIVGGDVDNGSSDNCGPITLSVVPSAFTCAEIGANNVTLTVTDLYGNTDQCVAVVTVEDNVAPTAVCQNITVQLDATGNVSIVAADIDGGSTDNCSVASLAASQTAFDCSHVGANNVTLTVTDGSGNTATCVAVVTVEDVELPTITCPGNQTETPDANCEFTLIDYTGLATANDNCSAVVTQSPAIGTVITTTTTVTLTATDPSGNTATCTFDVLLDDTTPPTAVCQNITVQLDATGNIAIVAADVDGGSSDNCGAVTLSATPLAFTCADIGANTVTLTVTDGSGNVSTCNATVTVEDNLAPTAVCQNITVQLDATGNATITTADIDNGSTDNCSVASLALDVTAFTCADVGANNVTLTVTDPSGNFSTCAAVVTVEDVELPTITCPGNQTETPDANCEFTLIDYTGLATAADNCSAVVTQSPAIGTVITTTTTVTLTATDPSGNTATCTFDVLLDDTTPPTAVCQNITVQLDATGNIAIVAADIDNGSNDNCGAVTLSATPLAFTCADIGANTVTLTVTDGSGNVSTCNATVTVEDNVPPVAVCQNITVQLDATGNASIVPADIDNGSTDNCSVVSTTLDITAFTCADLGANTVTLTVEDQSGNTSTCAATVTVEDNIAPTITCPADQSETADAACQFTLADYTGLGTTTDNCSSVITQSPLPGTIVAGSQVVTLTATDPAGNTTTCTFNVNVIDNTAPTAVCQDITVQLDATGNASIVAADIDNGSTDNCGIASLALDQTAFTCADLGVVTVTLTVTDGNGNTDQCTANVTVEDNIVPTALCQNITVQLDATGNAAIVAADIDGGSTDNCSIASLAASQTAFTCADIGANVITLTVTDGSGNTSTCAATVTVEDNVPPVAVCQNITVQLDATGNAVIVGGDVDNGSSDNCGPITLSVVPSAFTCAEIGANNVTLTVTDLYGNTDQCVAVVTVEDNVAPTAVCQNITIQLDATGNVSIVAADIDGGSTDNCSIASLAASQTAFDCSHVGANNVTLTVTDGSGNTATCVAVVTVEDLELPTITCPGNQTETPDANCEFTLIDYTGLATANDNCSAVVTQSPAIGTVITTTTTVTLTATDPSGNTATCTFDVLLDDTTPPTAVCQNITVQLDATGNIAIVAADVDGGSSDNCGAVTLTATPLAFTCADLGANTVTLTVTDGSGNVSTCNATVTVEDNIAPTAVCQNITVQLDATGNASIVPADIDNGSTDNCSVVSTTLDITAFTCANLGANTVTLTVEDQSGNISTCAATVTVEDIIAPTITCPADQSEAADANCQFTLGDYTALGTTADNCAAVITQSPLPGTVVAGSQVVTLTATDASGNTATCTFNVNVIDNSPPTALCQNITVQLDATGNVTIASLDVDAGSTDNCGIQSIIASDTTFTCSDIGVNTITLTVTDANGNVSTCNADVTVEDNVAPTALCQNVTIQLDATGNASITVADIDAGSTDNCTIVNMSLDQTAFDCSHVGGNLVTLSVEDQSGNISTCVATVTVEDNVPPIVNCQNITVQLDATGNVAIVAADVVASSSDNCAIATTTVSQSAFTCSDVGVNTVTVTVTDVNGNVSTCTADVTVEDNVAPTAVCQNITIQLDATGNASIVAADIDGGSTDNCAIATITASQTAFDCTNVGPNNVTLTVTDVNGNSSTCVAVVTVEDNVAPIVVCQNITVQLDPTGNISIVPADVVASSSDNCSIASTSLSQSAFTCADVGVNTITITVTDVNGNVSTCNADVTVQDTELPTAVCQNITIQLDATGNVSIVAADIDGGSTDNCGITSIAASQTAFTCADIGPNNVTLTVTDVNGNVSTCVAVVTVEDIEPPVAVCQNITIQLDATGNASIVAADIDGGSTDNCGIASIVASQTAFTCIEVGANTVTLTVTDLSGNVSTCNATVTVEDITAPTAICQNITVYLDATGNVAIAPADVDNGSFDNCSIVSSVIDIAAFDCTTLGANNVTLTVTDASGNASTCVSTVTVLDTLVPTLVCPIDQNEPANANCEFQLVDYTPLATISDNCNVTVTQSPAPGAFISGTVPVTITVVDDAGNSTSCTFNVTVVDVIPPTPVCQNITVQLDAAGSATITALDIDNGSFDNCGIDTLTLDQYSFTCADLGANTVTLTVLDINGLSSTCNATVTVEDIIAPTAICQNLTVQLDGTGNATITPAMLDNGSFDNCTIVSITASQTAFDCTNVGPNNVTLTVEDQSGNISTCTGVVTIEDNVDPIAVCQNVTINLDATGNATISPINVDGGSTDNCIIAAFDLSDTTFTCADIGINTETLTVTDVYGNSATCVADITVVDVTPPTAICQNVTAYLDATGNITVSPADIDNGSTDNCTVTNLTLDVSNFDCTNLGANPVVLSVEDQSANTSTCNATVTVLDTIAPTAICQNFTLVLDPTGNATLLPSDIDAGSFDNCTIVTYSVNISAFDCSNVGANSVILTVEDQSGNTSSCTATVTVVDTELPTAICQNITVQLDATGTVGIIPTDVDGGSFDNCGITNMSIDINSFDCSNLGPNNVQFTVEDPSANTSTCTAVVTVEDNVAPIPVCQNITVYLDPTGNVTISPNDIDNGSTDNCTVAAMYLDISSFTCAELGNNAVVLTVEDQSGNTATCNATVTVVDTIPPTALCQNVTTYLDPAGNTSILASDVDAASVDNCTINSMLLSQSIYDCSHVGNNPVTLTLTDQSGNISTCSSVVTVVDTVSPIANCQPLTIYLDANGLASITANDVDAGSNDNCAVDTIYLDNYSFDCINLGANTVVLTVEDVNGNSSTCSSTITVLDTIAPTAICQNITVNLDVAGQATIVSADIGSASFDNCTIASSTIDVSFFDCSMLGNNNVQLTLVDQSGNTSTCVAVANVVDTISPVINCPFDQIEYADANCEFVVPDYIPMGSTTDNCSIVSFTQSPLAGTVVNSGITTITLTSEDQSGNISFCDFELDVFDTIVPTIVCPNDTIICQEDGAYAWPEPVGIDNCSGSVTTQILGLSSGSLLPDGINTISYEVIDAVGNSASCSFEIDNVRCALELDIPDAITPNADGYNDEWIIPNLTLWFPECYVEIYNRWGTQIFKSDGYNIPWNGKYDNYDLPTGSYYYVIRLNDEAGTVFTGYVSVVTKF